MRPHAYIQRIMANALRDDAQLAEAGVTVLEQNSQALAVLLAERDNRPTAPVVVVTCDRAAKRATEPVTWDLECSVMASENVPANRDGAGFLTALDVIFISCEALAAVPGLHQTAEPVRHTTPGRGILEAEARFAARVEYDENEEQKEIE